MSGTTGDGSIAIGTGSNIIHSGSIAIDSGTAFLDDSCKANINDRLLAKIIREKLDTQRFATVLCVEKFTQFPDPICRIIADYTCISGKILDLIIAEKSSIYTCMKDGGSSTWKITFERTRCSIIYCNFSSHIKLSVQCEEIGFIMFFYGFYHLFQNNDIEIHNAPHQNKIDKRACEDKNDIYQKLFGLLQQKLLKMI